MARAHGRLLLLHLLASFLASAAMGAAAAALHDDAAAPRSSPSISAAPEYPPPLPRLPTNQHHHAAAGSPAALPPSALLSPDIMPVLPSPAEDGAAPPGAEEEPTIPSSPSPPNPDALEPDSALAPFGSAHAVAAQSGAAAVTASAPALPLLLGLLLAAMSWLLV